MVIDDTKIILSEADNVGINWIGREELINDLKAAWIKVGKNDNPMNPVLVGDPGNGKTTLAFKAAQLFDQPTYTINCTSDVRPEDLVIKTGVNSEGKIVYNASKIVSAMINGGICILDEANRMNEKSWASIASLLDDRKYLDSNIPQLRIEAHPEFRIIAVMNDDPSTYMIPEYIQSRLSPKIPVEAPENEYELFEIIKSNVDYATDEFIQLAIETMKSRESETLSIRNLIKKIEYAWKYKLTNPDKNQRDALKKGFES